MAFDLTRHWLRVQHLQPFSGGGTLFYGGHGLKQHSLVMLLPELHRAYRSAKQEDPQNHQYS